MLKKVGYISHSIDNLSNLIKFYSPVAKEEFDSVKRMKKIEPPCVSICQGHPIDVDGCNQEVSSQFYKKSVRNLFRNIKIFKLKLFLVLLYTYSTVY